jgi:hypothetical protein
MLLESLRAPPGLALTFRGREDGGITPVRRRSGGRRIPTSMVFPTDFVLCELDTRAAAFAKTTPRRRL